METTPTIIENRVGDYLSEDARQYFEHVAAVYSARVPAAIANTAERALEMDELGLIKNAAKQTKERADQFTKPLKALLDKIADVVKPATMALAAAELKSKQAILAFDNEQTRLIEAARKAQQEAENEAAKAKQQALEDAAIEAEFAGKKEEAQVLAAQAEVVQPAKIAEVVIKQEGARTIWKYRITDKNLVPREYLTINESLIGSIVRGSKGDVCIPGVEVYSEKILAAGGK